MSVIDDIKSRIDIVQLLSEYLQVKKVGSRFAALCPFHHEKTPSLSISPQNQFWYCFGCNEGGDIFDFVMKMEGLDFIEARDQLARKAGVEVRPEDIKRQSEKQRLIAANTLAAKFFHYVLTKLPAGARGKTYAEKRRLSAETIDAWQIGCAPDAWDALLGFLRQRGVPDVDAVASGLALKRERGPGSFDRFRNRLMLPISDLQGNVVGFTGRILPTADGSDAKDAKYVNTSQTAVYDKGHVVFGLDRAKQEIKKKGFAIVVEGNMDVISSHQAGVKHVVGSSGTAFTAAQLGLIKRFCDRLVLSFDADAAGEQAARRAVDVAVAAGFAVRILRLPKDAGKDPDDCIRKDPSLWTAAIIAAAPYMEWYFDAARTQTDFNDGESKRRSADALLHEIAKIPDPVERSHWVRRLGSDFATPEPLLYEKLATLKQTVGASVKPASNQTKAPGAKLPQKAMGRRDVASDLIVGSLLCWPMETGPLLADLTVDLLAEPVHGLYMAAFLRYSQPGNGGPTSVDDKARDRSLTGAVSREGDCGREAALCARAERDFGDLTPEARRSALVELIGEISALHRNRRQRELVAEMAKAEATGDTRSIEAIQQSLKELSA